MIRSQWHLLTCFATVFNFLPNQYSAILAWGHAIIAQGKTEHHVLKYALVSQSRDLAYKKKSYNCREAFYVHLHPTICFLSLLLQHSGSQGRWSLSQQFWGWMRGYTLDKSPSHCRATLHKSPTTALSHSWRSFRVATTQTQGEHANFTQKVDGLELNLQHFLL